MENKVLLLLGASADIGIELIKNSHTKYDFIIAHYNNNKSGLEELKKELGKKLILHKADFIKLEEVKELIENIKKEGIMPTSIVHLPADKYFIEKFKKTEWESFQTGIDISIRSLVHILKSFLPIMGKKHSGKVVVLLSSYTNNNPPKYLSSYGMVKYALLGLVKGLSAEYADKNININAVSPSMVETKFLSEISEYIVLQNAESNPRGRNVLVSEVVPTIEFLLSDQANFITGQNIFITGGQ